MLDTEDMLEIVARGGNGAEYVDLPALLLRAAAELRAARRSRRDVLLEAQEYCRAYGAQARTFGHVPADPFTAIEEAARDLAVGIGLLNLRVAGTDSTPTADCRLPTADSQ